MAQQRAWQSLRVALLSSAASINKGCPHGPLGTAAELAGANVAVPAFPAGRQMGPRAARGRRVACLEWSCIVREVRRLLRTMWRRGKMEKMPFEILRSVVWYQVIPRESLDFGWRYSTMVGYSSAKNHPTTRTRASPLPPCRPLRDLLELSNLWNTPTSTPRRLRDRRDGEAASLRVTSWYVHRRSWHAS